jgi:hypothetical protein
MAIPAVILKAVIIFIQFVKLLINATVIILYRRGDHGHFMGASYNKNHDTESLTMGVFVGFMIFNNAQLISHIFVYIYDRGNRNKPMIMEVILNVIGVLLWTTAGIMIIQFWTSFIGANQFIVSNTKTKGIVMGALAVLNAGLYAAEILLVWMNYKMNFSRRNSNSSNKGGIVYIHGGRGGKDKEMQVLNQREI